MRAGLLPRLEWGDASLALEVGRTDGFSLPAGTVTFLLADVEGSVRRWEEDQKAMAKDMARFPKIIDAAVGKHDGVRRVGQGEGDSVLVAFAQASDALVCALAIQRTLASELPHIRLRMALHTGESQRRDVAHYFDPAINRCARLRDIGHGGQILLSRTTYDLVVERIPEGAWLWDLGSHRLRDLARPEDVFQLCHSDLDEEFPPLRSLDALPNNLPVQLTSFIGREAAIADVERLLSESRAITLTGSGGCGKTRLAVQVAAVILDRFPDGVWWVDLAPVADPNLVPSAVVDVLSIRDALMPSLTEAIKDHLRDRRALILLDNCEHLVDACASLATAILTACPSVAIVATSRETLGIEGEVAFRVPSLTLPEETAPARIDALSQYEAVALFIDRAARARPNFRVSNENAPGVAEICHRLDGIPLAIELAAARVRMLSIDQICSGLTDVFHLLAGGSRTALPRQQTLLASVDWSYGLLSEEERILLHRLSIFAGGFGLDAAEAVCAGGAIDPYGVLELLSSLMDRSLVQADEMGDEIRYRLLETIRQYARRKLAESKEASEARARHLGYYADLAERAAPELQGPDSIEWLSRLDTEIDNIRAALDWSAVSNDGEVGLRLCAAIFFYWDVRGLSREGRDRFETLLMQPETDPILRAKSLYGHGANCMFLHDWDAARRSGEEVRSIGRDLGDERLIGLGAYIEGAAARWAGDWARGRSLLEEAIDIGLRFDDAPVRVGALWAVASGLAFNEGDFGAAREAFQELLDVARGSSNQIWVASALAQFAGVELFLGHLRDIEQMAKEAIPILEQAGWGERRGMVHQYAGGARVLAGDYPGARAHLDEALLLAVSVQSPTLAKVQIWRALLHLATGELERAAEESDSGLRVVAACRIAAVSAYNFLVSAEIGLERRDFDRVEAMIAEVEGILDQLDHHLVRGWLSVVKGKLARETDDDVVAESLIHEGLASLVASSARPWIIDALELVASLAASQESYLEAARLAGAAQAARDEIGYVRFASRQQRYEDDNERMRAALGSEGFEKAWAEGTAMSFEDAVAYAQRGRGERKRPSAGWASLTPAELQVADLVAHRLTNPQIAERLFVSRDTVKAHLSHIFAKLGISSRADLADEVAKHATSVRSS